MVNTIYKKYFSENIIQHQINFLFISFIFLFGLKYDYLQFRFLILILLIPCGLKIIQECINKNFRNTIVFFFFLLILISHSFLNIYFENANITKYNLFGIFLLTCIFIISFYFYENFNKNILNLVKLFLLIFFISILFSFFLNFKKDAPFFCGGIPDIFGILKYETYLPDVSNFVLNYLELNRIGEMKFSFKEYIFPENSHLGMIAPSIMIYLIHLNFTSNIDKYLRYFIFIFILICIIKSSTTLLVGTIASLILLITFNFKSISKKTLIAFVSIIIIFFTILISSKECRSRFVPIYYESHTVENSNDIKKSKIVGEVNSKFAFKLKNLLGVEGNFSAGVYFHALNIAKRFMDEGLNVYFIELQQEDASDLGFKKITEIIEETGVMTFQRLMDQVNLFAH